MNCSNIGSDSTSTQAAAERARNKDGRFRQKRGDTHLSTLEDKYGEISDRRADTHLSTLRELTGMSLSKIVRTETVEVTHATDLSGRHRNQDGRIRAKSGSTHLSTLEEKYGELSSLPDDTHLSVISTMMGGVSLSYMLKHRDLIPQG